MRYLILIVLLTSGSAFGAPIRLFPGYVTKLFCEGRLLISSVGNENLVRLDPLPREIGCAVLLKPMSPSGRTNLILETSAGSVQMTVEIRIGTPTAEDLKYSVKGER